MRQLLPEPVDVIDPVTAHAGALRPPPEDRPWVLLTMVASMDGATAIDGVSGTLGGSGDKEVFRAIRAVADVILVAAGTVRAEGYGPPQTSSELQALRRARGQQPFPRIAVITGSLDLDPTARLFTGGEPPLIFTGSAAPAERLVALGEVAEIRQSPEPRPPLEDVLGALRRDGANVVACEGGPSLNGQLVELGLVDEVNLTLAASLVGGSSHRVAVGGGARPTLHSLAHLWEDGDDLFLRYVARA